MQSDSRHAAPNNSFNRSGISLDFIRKSGLLVADFTGQRGGVYFEAGFALGLGIPVIWTCRDTDVENLHFDTRQYNHIVWTDAADLKERLINRIEATLPDRPKSKPEGL